MVFTAFFNSYKASAAKPRRRKEPQNHGNHPPFILALRYAVKLKPSTLLHLFYWVDCIELFYQTLSIAPHRTANYFGL